MFSFDAIKLSVRYLLCRIGWDGLERENKIGKYAEEGQTCVATGTPILPLSYLLEKVRTYTLHTYTPFFIIIIIKGRSVVEALVGVSL